MRAALLSTLVLVLAVPAGWAAASPAGTLSIESGRGTVVLTGKGIVIGRLEKGDVKIVDVSPLDQWSPRVNGVPRGKTVWLRGKDVNFYVPGGRYRITVRGEGFSISARGQGSVTVTGNPDAAGATGTYAVGDGSPSTIPATAETVSFGPAAGEGATTKEVAP
jgi:hypothetical protein